MGSHEDEFGVDSPEDSVTQNALPAQVHEINRFAPPTAVPVRPAMAPIDVNSILAQTLAPLLPEGYTPEVSNGGHQSRHAAVVPSSLPSEVAAILSPDLREKLEREERARVAAALQASTPAPVALDVPTVLAPAAAVVPQVVLPTAPVVPAVPLSPGARPVVDVVAAAAVSQVAPLLTRREARELAEKAERQAAKQEKKAEKKAEKVEKKAEKLEAAADPKVAKSPRQSSKPVVLARKLKQSASTRPGTKPAAKPDESPKRRTGRMVTLISMAFIAGLAVATSVPANALLTPDELRAMNLGISTGYVESQAVQAGAGEAITGRDKVSATLYDGRTGFISGVTYVNNPNGKIQWPIRVTVPMSDLYGTREDPFGGGGTVFHHGIDFNPGIGFPIQSIADGVVVGIFQEEYSSLGYHVIVEHNIKGQKVWSVYAHLKEGSIQVKLGQRLQVTDIIGQCGDSGYSTGAHLHFEIRVDEINGYTDPLAWLRANAK